MVPFLKPQRARSPAAAARTRGVCGIRSREICIILTTFKAREGFIILDQGFDLENNWTVSMYGYLEKILRTRPVRPPPCRAYRVTLDHKFFQDDR